MNRIIPYTLENERATSAYILDEIIIDEYNKLLYLYVQNKIIGITTQHIPADEENEAEDVTVRTAIICEYCVIPEADALLNQVKP